MKPSLKLLQMERALLFHIFSFLSLPNNRSHQKVVGGSSTHEICLISIENLNLILATGLISLCRLQLVSRRRQKNIEPGFKMAHGIKCFREIRGDRGQLERFAHEPDPKHARKRDDWVTFWYTTNVQPLSLSLYLFTLPVFLHHKQPNRAKKWFHI